MSPHSWSRIAAALWLAAAVCVQAQVMPADEAMLNDQPVQAQLEFFGALERSDWPQIRHWLARGMDVNRGQGYGFEQGRTPLMLAASSGSVALTDFLLAQGAQVNARAQSSLETALFKAVRFAGSRGDDAAVRAGYDAVVQRLLKAGADPNLADHNGFLPLYFAPDAAMLRLLLKGGANPKAQTRWPPLLAHGAYADRLQLLLDAKVDPNGVDTQGQTALHIAAREGQVDAVRLLLPAMSPEAIHRLDESRQSALDAAAAGGSAEVVALLLSKRLVPSAATWHFALQGGHLRAAAVLLATPLSGSWPLPEGREQYRGRLYGLILQGKKSEAREAYQDIQASVCGRQTPLMQAVDMSNEEAVQALLSLGIDVNFQAPEPLHSQSFVPLMSSSGRAVQQYVLPTPCSAQAVAVYGGGGSALQVAVARKSLRMAKLLIDAGADPTLRSHYASRSSAQSLWQVKAHEIRSDALAWRRLLRLP